MLAHSRTHAHMHARLNAECKVSAAPEKTMNRKNNGNENKCVRLLDKCQFHFSLYRMTSIIITYACVHHTRMHACIYAHTFWLPYPCLFHFLSLKQIRLCFHMRVRTLSQVILAAIVSMRLEETAFFCSFCAIVIEQKSDAM